jgi:hypothetical protein
MLTVVQDQQHLLPGQVPANSSHRIFAWGLRNARGGAHHCGQQPGIRQRFQAGPAHAAGELGPAPLGHRQR